MTPEEGTAQLEAGVAEMTIEQLRTEVIGLRGDVADMAHDLAIDGARAVEIAAAEQRADRFAAMAAAAGNGLDPVKVAEQFAAWCDRRRVEKPFTSKACGLLLDGAEDALADILAGRP